jgi:hypothetical protein
VWVEIWLLTIGVVKGGCLVRDVREESGGRNIRKEVPRVVRPQFTRKVTAIKGNSR